MSGYIVLEAASGREALRISAEQRRPSADDTDVVMPGMTGTELGVQLRGAAGDEGALHLGYADDARTTGCSTRAPSLQKPCQVRGAGAGSGNCWSERRPHVRTGHASTAGGRPMAAEAGEDRLQHGDEVGRPLQLDDQVTRLDFFQPAA